MCQQQNYLLNYRTDLFKTGINAHDPAFTVSFACINPFSRTLFLIKSLRLRIDSAASSGGQEKVPFASA